MMSMNPEPGNDRRRAVLVLVLVSVIGLVLVAGLALLVVDGLKADPKPAPSPPGHASGTPSAASSETGNDRAREDAIAAAPMMQLPLSAAQPHSLVTETAGPAISIPAPVKGVVPGGPPMVLYPHTPEGALGQLIAIDEVAMSTLDLARVHEVYAAATLPGAVDEQQWYPAVAINTLIKRLGGTAKTPTASSRYQVSQGQIKGVLGDFAVVCVLGEFEATAASLGRAGWGDCQRMVWRDGRWWIGPGSQPTRAPSAWPGSADAVRAGWREVVRSG
jgi:hypothetical protein